MSLSGPPVTGGDRKGSGMIVLRRLLGEALRRRRQDQGRTLREVSSTARVSLGYLSEVERGQKEASSELLAAICVALQVPLSEVLREVSESVAIAEGLPVLPVSPPVPAAVPMRVPTAVPATTGRMTVSNVAA